MLHGKKVLIGITGSIAAYKSLLLIRLLVKNNAEVKVVLTKKALDFITPLTVSTLSKNETVIDLHDNFQWENHVALGRWADIFIIAPATCNTLAKMASGFCDNLLLATYLSAKCKVLVAPAMDEDMWHHPTTHLNISKLKEAKVEVLHVNNGELASGLIGDGRMAEPEEIFNLLYEKLIRSNHLANKKVLITAGPTYEAIDPVRFIGNHSTGKMGFKIAESFYLKGADVHLVTGPTNEQTKFKNIHRHDVASAKSMYEKCISLHKECDIIIMSAAVADYTPILASNEKIKKVDDNLHLILNKTKDILYELGQKKLPHQFIVGFALETQNELEHAKQKLLSKNADCIVLNSLKDAHAGFGYDTNKITLIEKDGNAIEFFLKLKSEIAEDLTNYVISKINV